MSAAESEPVELRAEAEEDIWDGAVEALTEAAGDDIDWDRIKDIGRALTSAGKRGEYADAKRGDE